MRGAPRGAGKPWNRRDRPLPPGSRGGRRGTPRVLPGTRDRPRRRRAGSAAGRRRRRPAPPRRRPGVRTERRSGADRGLEGVRQRRDGRGRRADGGAAAGRAAAVCDQGRRACRRQRCLRLPNQGRARRRPAGRRRPGRFASDRGAPRRRRGLALRGQRRAPGRRACTRSGLQARRRRRFRAEHRWNGLVLARAEIRACGRRGAPEHRPPPRSGRARSSRRAVRRAALRGPDDDRGRSARPRVQLPIRGSRDAVDRAAAGGRPASTAARGGNGKPERDDRGAQHGGRDDRPRRTRLSAAERRRHADPGRARGRGKRGARLPRRDGNTRGDPRDQRRPDPERHRHRPGSRLGPRRGIRGRRSDFFPGNALPHRHRRGRGGACRLTGRSSASSSARNPTVSGCRPRSTSSISVAWRTSSRSALRTARRTQWPNTRGQAAASGASRLSAVIARYSRPAMARIWSDEGKLVRWLEVELAALEGWAEAGVVPAETVAEISAAAVPPAPERVAEIEEQTHHDVAAFVDAVAEELGPAGRWFHYGLTSSDVVDTALALQIRDAGALILAGLERAVAAVATRAEEHRETIQIGRTHGVHAEPLTFGLKLAGWAFELDRDRARLERALEGMRVGKLSGAVGTYSTTDPEVERAACERLGLEPAPVSTQILQRDRHAELLSALAVVAASLQKFPLEIRHPARTEVGEVQEPFGRGQKGSSAMPHKRNPVVAERICGLARIVRAAATVGLVDLDTVFDLSAYTRHIDTVFERLRALVRKEETVHA